MRALLIAWTAFAATPALGASMSGREVFNQVCAGCHQGGISGAPAIRDGPNWRKRAQQGEPVLVRHAITGVRAMPARGGSPGLSDAEIAAAVKYMLRTAVK